MGEALSFVDHNPNARATHALDELLGEIARLAASETSAREFYRQLLERLVRALGAVSGAVWESSSTSAAALVAELNPSGTDLFADRAAQHRHASLIPMMCQRREASVLPPDHHSTNGAERAHNPTGFALIFAPVITGGRFQALIEVFQPPIADVDTERGQLALVTAVCEMAGDFHARQQTRSLEIENHLCRQQIEFARSVHGHLDLLSTAYVTANDGRRLIGCDRLTVAVREGRRYRVLAISGVDVPDRRSNAVRRLERLVDAVMLAEEPLWYTESQADGTRWSPQVEEPLAAYIDLSQVRTLGVLPLRDASPESRNRTHRAVGALIVECFEHRDEQELERRASAICDHSATALRNAQWHENMPPVAALRALFSGLAGASRRQAPTLLLLLLIVGACIGLLTFVKADFAVEARGELQPQRRRHVFAPGDGVVDELRVAHGQNVAAGALLMSLRDTQLSLELQRIRGEIDALKKRLLAAQTIRLGNERDDARTEEHERVLTAQQEELTEQLRSHERQYEIVTQQHGRLRVTSPIVGQVLTWNVDQQLANRPVQRGQRLLTIGDLRGPWELDLRVPDYRAGHVMIAADRAGGPLEVSFMLASQPGTTYAARLSNVALSTESSEEQPSVSVIARIDGTPPAQPRPGTTVIARIHCGRRSLAFVWLHDIVEMFYRWVWF